MSDPTVPELLHRRCQTSRGRVALEGPETSRTFDELWSSAAVLAGAIAARLTDGDGPQPVAVVATADRVELVEAVVAVMLAGHAPLILDPDAPDDLQREWYWAAGARLVVADRATAIAAHRRFGYGTVAVTNRLRAERAAPLRTPLPHDPALLVPELHPEAGAVVHTLSHHDVLARAARDGQRVPLTDDDRLGLLVPLSSPAGTRALLAGLLAGAGTVLYDARTQGWAGLGPWLAQSRVTVAAITPTLVELAAGEPATPLPDLRRLMLLGPGRSGPHPPSGPDGDDTAVAGAGGIGIRAGTDAGPGGGRRGLAGVETVAVDDGAGDDGAGDDGAGDDGAPGTDGPATDLARDAELEATLTSLFQELLDVGSVDRDDDFFALGGHSLLAARLLVLLEQRTGRRLPMAVFLEATTVGQLAGALRQQAGAAPAAPLVTIQAGDPGRSPLFVTHDLQGSAWRFRDLARAVGEDQPIHGFESPMLEGRLRFATIEALAAHYVAAMRVVAPQGPYHLCGYSFGGILAFEMARVLEAQGDTVALLGVIDVGPGYRGLDYSRSRLPPLPYLRDAVARSPDGLPRWAAPLRHLWLNRWVLARRWRRVLRGGGTIAPGERLWFAWWAHWSLVGPDWAPSPYGGRVDLFWAETTAGTDATMGWGGHAREVCVHPVPGAHESLMAPPAVTTIGQGLRALLDGSEPRIGPAAAATTEAAGPPPRRRRLPGPDLALLPLLRPLIALDARVVERAFPLTNQSVDPFDIPWAPSIAARWPTIRAELDQLLADGIAMPDVNDVHDGGQGAEGPWTTYVLFSFGRWISANAARCPATTALIADVPDLETAGFTVLAPGTHIPLHRGPFRSLRYQLGVRVPGPPGACRLQVGDEVIVWEDGKSLAFDDAVEHEAWNDADEPRYVLFIQTRWPLPGWRGRVHAAVHHLLARPVRDLPERVRRLDATLNRPG